MEGSHIRSTMPLLIFFMLVSTAATAATARDTITPATPLADNETLVCSSKDFAVGFFTPTGSNKSYIGLWYNKISEPDGHTIVWVANRQNPLVGGSAGALLSVTADGRLTITSSVKEVVWKSPNSTVKTSNAVARLLDNGNLVVKQDGDVSGNYGWQGFDYLTDTLLAGMRIGLDRATGINRTLVAWTSATDPSPGPYYVFMDVKGDPDIYLYGQGSRPIFRTGPWDGTHLGGVPEMTTYKDLSYEFANNEEEVTYSYSTNNTLYVRRLTLNCTGVLQGAVWMRETRRWIHYSTLPKDLCDNFGYCGPYGHCDPNTTPMCGCLPGFVPKDPSNWIIVGVSNECVRNHELDCSRNGSTDGFNTVSDVKLPQSENCTVDMSLDLARCEQLCRRNCSCIAYASADVRDGGRGCVIWPVGDRLLDIRYFAVGGQVLYVRVAAADVVVTPGQSKGGSNSKVTIVVSLVVGGLLLIICVGCFLWRRKKKTKGTNNEQSNPETRRDDHDLDLPMFDFDTIAAVTDHFSPVHKLGEGGFGPVYKGTLGDGQEIAVKRLSRTSVQGIEEFKNEVVLIAKLQHRNLVRLLGCCIQGEERMLIYEYMPNTGLDAFLFEKGKGALLEWKTRYQIIIGIARGLLYLHQDSRFRIIHRDLKASNILLDKDMNPKISDFGMARIFGGDETDFNTRKVVGTYGYMSPEYAMDGVFSMKSDVFSFGVLVLEIISGKKNRGVYPVSPHMNLVAHAWSTWKEGKSMQLVDDSMSYLFPTNEVLKCIKLGLLCVQEQPDDRPLMSAVVLMLGSEHTTLPQPKKPGFAAKRGPFESDTSSSKQDSFNMADISLTMFEPR